MNYPRAQHEGKVILWSVPQRGTGFGWVWEEKSSSEAQVEEERILTTAWLECPASEHPSFEGVSFT